MKPTVKLDVKLLLRHVKKHVERLDAMPLLKPAEKYAVKPDVMQQLKRVEKLFGKPDVKLDKKLDNLHVVKLDVKPDDKVNMLVWLVDMLDDMPICIVSQKKQVDIEIINHIDVHFDLFQVDRSNVR